MPSTYYVRPEKVHLPARPVLFFLIPLIFMLGSPFGSSALAQSKLQSSPSVTLPGWKQFVTDCVTGDHFVENQYGNKPDPNCDDWRTDLYERPGYAEAIDFTMSDLAGLRISRRDHELERASPVITRMLPVKALETIAAAARLNASIALASSPR